MIFLKLAISQTSTLNAGHKFTRKYGILINPVIKEPCLDVIAKLSACRSICHLPEEYLWKRALWRSINQGSGCGSGSDPFFEIISDPDTGVQRHIYGSCFLKRQDPGFHRTTILSMKYLEKKYKSEILIIKIQINKLRVKLIWPNPDPDLYYNFDHKRSTEKNYW